MSNPAFHALKIENDKLRLIEGRTFRENEMLKRRLAAAEEVFKALLFAKDHARAFIGDSGDVETLPEIEDAIKTWEDEKPI